MSKILTTEEAAALRSEKADLNNQMMSALAAGNMGASTRLAKQVSGIQAALDDDVAERDRTGYDEARGKMTSLAALVNGSGRSGSPHNAELRAFLTPGSSVTQMWAGPDREQIMAPAKSYRATTYLTTDTTTTGAGYYFTSELYRSVIMSLLESSGVLEADPTLIVTNHLRDIQVPVLTADAVASAGTEGSAATATNTEGDAVTLGSYRFDGAFKVSLETIMASEYDLESLLAQFATRAVANQTAAMLALGNGTTQPQGVFTASAVTVGKTCASATAPTVDEVLEMSKALPKGYRKNARHVWSDVLHTSMLQFKNADGDYMLRSVEAGGYEFGGKPVFTEPQADQTSMSADEIHGVYGDFTAGYFVRATPMFLKRTDGDDPLNPLVTFAIWLDAKVVDANALVSLKMSS